MADITWDDKTNFGPPPEGVESTEYVSAEDMNEVKSAVNSKADAGVSADADNALSVGSDGLPFLDEDDLGEGGGEGVTDGDKGDILVEDDGAVWTIIREALLTAIEDVAEDETLGPQLQTILETLLSFVEIVFTQPGILLAVPGAEPGDPTTLVDEYFAGAADIWLATSATQPMSPALYAASFVPTAVPDTATTEIDLELGRVFSLAPLANRTLAAANLTDKRGWPVWAFVTQDSTPRTYSAGTGINFVGGSLPLNSGTGVKTLLFGHVNDTEDAIDLVSLASPSGSYQPLDADLTAIAALAKTDGNVIVGDGSTWVAESGATARTSLGLGTGDSPQFTGIELGHATANTLTASSGNMSIEGNVVYRAGGTDVPVTDGGTGASDAATARTNLGVAATSHTHAASDIASGTLVHERGGLEADVSAYSGLVRITGGATSAVVPASAADIHAGTEAVEYITPSTAKDAAASVSLADGATITVTINAGIHFHTAAITATRALAVSGTGVPGRCGTIRVLQNGTGGFGLTAGSGVTSLSGAIVLANDGANGISIVPYRTNAAGTGIEVP